MKHYENLPSHRAKGSTIYLVQTKSRQLVQTHGRMPDKHTNMKGWGKEYKGWGQEGAFYTLHQPTTSLSSFLMSFGNDVLCLFYSQQMRLIRTKRQKIKRTERENFDRSEANRPKCWNMAIRQWNCVFYDALTVQNMLWTCSQSRPASEHPLCIRPLPEIHQLSSTIHPCYPTTWCLKDFKSSTRLQHGSPPNPPLSWVPDSPEVNFGHGTRGHEGPETLPGDSWISRESVAFLGLRVQKPLSRVSNLLKSCLALEEERSNWGSVIKHSPTLMNHSSSTPLPVNSTPVPASARCTWVNGSWWCNETVFPANPLTAGSMCCFCQSLLKTGSPHGWTGFLVMNVLLMQYLCIYIYNYIIIYSSTFICRCA